MSRGSPGLSGAKPANGAADGQKSFKILTNRPFSLPSQVSLEDLTVSPFDRTGCDLSALHSVASGAPQAPVLLLSNSLGATTAMWNAQMPLFERHFRVIRYDTRGHGLSETPPGPYDWEVLVNDAFTVLDTHNVRTATVVGVSLGAMTALGMALARPDRIERLVFAAGRADAPPPFVQSWDDRLAVLDKGSLADVWAVTRPRWLTESFQAAAPDAVEDLRAGFLQTTPDGYRGCAAALKRLDYLRHLTAITAPVLCIAGAEDLAAPPAAVRAVAAACGNGHYTEIDKAAHIVNVNRPRAFNRAVSEFLGLAPE